MIKTKKWIIFLTSISCLTLGCKKERDLQSQPLEPMQTVSPQTEATPVHPPEVSPTAEPALTPTVSETALPPDARFFEGREVQHLGEKTAVRLVDLEGKAFCSGILVSQQTVLTSATCLKDENGRTKLPGEVRIALSNNLYIPITKLVARPVTFAGTSSEDLDLGLAHVELPESFKVATEEFPALPEPTASLKPAGSVRYFMQVFLASLPRASGVQETSEQEKGILEIVDSFGGPKDPSDFSSKSITRGINDKDVAEFLLGPLIPFCSEMRGAPLLASSASQKTLVGIVSRPLISRKLETDPNCFKSGPVIATKAGWFKRWTEIRP